MPSARGESTTVFHKALGCYSDRQTHQTEVADHTAATEDARSLPHRAQTDLTVVWLLAVLIPLGTLLSEEITSISPLICCWNPSSHHPGLCLLPL